jgi:hypothetical protein
LRKPSGHGGIIYLILSTSLSDDPDPTIANEGYNQCLEYVLAGRIIFDPLLPADHQQILREIVDKVRGRFSEVPLI